MGPQGLHAAQATWECGSYLGALNRSVINHTAFSEVGRNTVHWGVFSLKQMGSNYEF